MSSLRDASVKWYSFEMSLKRVIQCKYVHVALYVVLATVILNGLFMFSKCPFCAIYFSTGTVLTKEWKIVILQGMIIHQTSKLQQILKYDAKLL